MKHPFFLLPFMMTGLMIMPGCSHRSKIMRKKITVYTTKEPHEAPSITGPIETPPITIWIHGTKLWRNKGFSTLFNNTAQLKSVHEIPARHHLRTVGDVLHANAPELFPQETFYTFGWSGKLRAAEREECAHRLYEEIQRVSQEYWQEYGTQPFIRMITHSHGGNIALNLAKINAKKNQIGAIDELILLACPVQLNTKEFLKDPLFQKVHTFYSSVDFVQVIAPQIYYKTTTMRNGKVQSETKMPIFSKRRFDEHEKLTQVNVRMNGRAIFHNEFISPGFLKTLPHVLRELREWETECYAPQDTKKKKRLLCIYTKRWKMGRTAQT